MPENWVDVGAADELKTTPLRRISVQNRDIALSFRDDTFGALANACNHVGGPLGDGRPDPAAGACHDDHGPGQAEVGQTHGGLRRRS